MARPLTEPRLLLDRVAVFFGAALCSRETGEPEDPDGLAVEAFELADNLMLVGGVLASGGCIIADITSEAERFTALLAFERCLAHAAAALSVECLRR